MEKNLIIFLSIFLCAVVAGGILLARREIPQTATVSEPLMPEKIVREPAVAGQFYPASAEELEKMIDQFLENAKVPETEGSPSQVSQSETWEGEVFALVLPHAGYPFSGRVAAHGFKRLLGREIDTVILIGNSHYERFEGASVFSEGFYKTPLGEIEINSELAQRIIDEDERIFFRESAHQSEHSLEVELPFLQKTLKNFKIVPIILGNTPGNDYKILAQAIAKNIKDKNVLLIASSDLSHYPPYEDAKTVDSKTIEAILTGRVEELEKTIEDLESQGIPGSVTFACAEDAIKTVMLVAKEMGADEIKLLNYANSGDVPIGDRSGVVGYAAIGFFGKSFKVGRSVQFETFKLAKAQQQELLQIARNSVETYIRTGKMPELEAEFPVGSVLNQNLGAFVTLKKHGQLRGCIGRFSPTDIPLYQVVSQMAVAAATQDTRFLAVQQDELADLHYEISVLSPLKQIDNWQEIELGKHGVQIKRGPRSGVFLPQVATENNWDLDKFMAELCFQKAGLARDCWKDQDTDLYIFSAQVFEEEQE